MMNMIGMMILTAIVLIMAIIVIRVSFNRLCSSAQSIVHGDVLSEKLISPHTGPQIPPTLAQITLTHSTSMSELLADHIAPPGGQI